MARSVAGFEGRAVACTKESASVTAIIDALSALPHDTTRTISGRSVA
jgi:hypothetical protein